MTDTTTPTKSEVVGEYATKLIQHILTGKLDDHIPGITAAVNKRLQMQRDRHIRQVMNRIEVGDEIVIGSVRPKYYQGARASVVEFSPRGATIKVRLLTSVGVGNTRRHPGMGLTIHPNSVHQIWRGAEQIL